MAYSVIEGRFYYSDGDHFDFEGFVEGRWGGGSFIAGERINPGDLKGWEFDLDAIPTSYVTIDKAENFGGSIYDHPSYDWEDLVVTNYYDSDSGRNVVPAEKRYGGDAYHFADFDGKLFVEGMTYKFDSGTSINLPTPTPETSSDIDVPVDKKWSKYLWEKSGRDGIIDYYADKKGKLDKKQNTKITNKTLSFIDEMLDETGLILGLQFNKAKKSNQADIIFQAKSKDEHTATYKTKYGMEVSFLKTQKKPTQYDMQDINYHTGLALGLEDLKGNSYDAADSAMAANFSDKYLGWSNNDIRALQSIW
jgi:hypothetical protein